MTPLIDGERKSRSLHDRLKSDSPSCERCVHYWPTVYGPHCMYPVLWDGEPEEIDETSSGHCVSFEYRSRRELK